MAQAVYADLNKHEVPPWKQGSGVAGLVFIGVPRLLAAICLADKFGFVSIPPGPRAALPRSGDANPGPSAAAYGA